VETTWNCRKGNAMSTHIVGVMCVQGTYVGLGG